MGLGKGEMGTVFKCSQARGWASGGGRTYGRGPHDSAEGLELEVRVGFEPDGAVVGAEDVGEDVAVCEVGAQGGGGAPIVEPPSDVLGAVIAAIGPPGVAAGGPGRSRDFIAFQRRNLADLFHDAM